VYSATHSKGYENEEYKDFIKSVKFGETGYVYLIDSSGILTVHFKSEGVNVGEHDFAKKIIANKSGGIEYYYWEATKQD
jgi:methyl-accepting chemotaxis protein